MPFDAAMPFLSATVGTSESSSDLTFALVGLLGALVGGVLSTLLTELGKSRAILLEERRDDSRIKRLAFAEYLVSAGRMHTFLTRQVRESVAAGGAADYSSMDTEEFRHLRDEYLQRQSAMLFLVDQEGAEGLYSLGRKIVPQPTDEGRRDLPEPFTELSVDVLQAMRRSLHLK